MAVVTDEMIQGCVWTSSDPSSEEQMDLDVSKSVRPVSTVMTSNVGEVSAGANDDSTQGLPLLEVPSKPSFRNMVREALPQRSEDDIYDPWMQAKRRRRQGTTNRLDSREKSVRHSIVGFHFGVLNSLEELSLVEKLPHQVAPSSGEIMATVMQEEVMHTAAVIPQTNDVVGSNLETNEGTNMVAARDKVVAAPTTLQVDKHNVA
ncbi:hypothetical protein V6N13_043708 [Hibiscus sabdariffa]